MRGFAAITVSVLAGSVSTVQADVLQIELPGAVEQVEAVYRCPDTEISTTYYNAESNALAVLRFGDQTLVMTNVLAASGAKYAGGPYVWWTKGETADLYDLMKGEDAAPVSCTEVK